jgi:hypothetical protein
MFAGCEVELDAEPGPEGAPSFHGGIYPFTFERSGPVPEPPGPHDTNAELRGRWSGVSASPLGQVPVELEVEQGHFRATLLSVRSVAAEAARVGEGRVEGQLEVSLAALGDWVMFFRLVARGGALEGSIYARGAMGEFRFPIRLEGSA